MSMQGRCQCGALHYALSSEPVLVYACHCSDCQKRTGSAFSMGALVPVSELSLHGPLSEWSRISEAGHRNTRYSCADCGNIIYGEGENAPGIAKLQVGTLDNTKAMLPHVHIWTRSAQAWLKLPEAAPQFATQPDTAEALLQAGLAYKNALEA